jgi:hypothetical protein
MQFFLLFLKEINLHNKILTLVYISTPSVSNIILLF